MPTKFTTKAKSYVARPVDAKGYAHYTPEENSVWQILINRQMETVKNRACPEYLEGLAKLNLPKDRVPECPEISAVLRATTGWELTPVAALIPFEEFFGLLANRKFPAATFIRRREELDYLEEPDIFHEVFGHCPLLTNPAIADFTQIYGKLGLAANNADRALLARLYWFTIEFGLIQSPQGIRAYGGGILSSHNETIYSVDSKVPERKRFNVLDALRTPYRIDIMQPVYFVLDSFQTLYHLIDMDLIAEIEKARTMGEFAPLFETEKEKNHD